MKKRKLGIRFRVFLEVGAIFVVCLIALVVVNSQILENVYMWNEELSLKQMAEDAENYTGDYYPLLLQYEIQNNVSIDLYDNNDNYIYEGSGNFVSGKKLIVVSRTENEDGSYFNILQEEDSSTQYILYGKDFKNGYHIEITSQQDVIKENASIATRVTTIIAVFALLLSLIYISGYAKRFTKPIIKITEAANKMSNLDFSEKCEISSVVSTPKSCLMTSLNSSLALNFFAESFKVSSISSPALPHPVQPTQPTVPLQTSRRCSHLPYSLTVTPLKMHRCLTS